MSVVAILTDLEKQKERFVASSREEVNGRLMTGV